MCDYLQKYTMYHACIINNIPNVMQLHCNIIFH